MSHTHVHPYQTNQAPHYCEDCADLYGDGWCVSSGGRAQVFGTYLEAYEWLAERRKEPMVIQPLTDTAKAMRKTIAHAAEVAEKVDELADELLDSSGTIDLENFRYLRIRDIDDALEILYGIITVDFQVTQVGAGPQEHNQLLVESVTRALELVSAIRQALASR